MNHKVECKLMGGKDFRHFGMENDSSEWQRGQCLISTGPSLVVGDGGAILFFFFFALFSKSKEP